MNSHEREILLNELRDSDYKVRAEAKHRLRSEGWLRDGRIVGASLAGLDFSLDYSSFENAKLAFVDFSHCNLHEVQFIGSDLHAALFKNADLRSSFWDCQATNANFDYADCRYALLHHSFAESSFVNCNMSCAFISGNLSGAIFINANLEGTHLGDANMRGVNLSNANLLNLKLDVDSIECDETTILPDGTQWAVGTDWDRFTDSSHTIFWRSEIPE